MHDRAHVRDESTTSLRRALVGRATWFHWHRDCAGLPTQVKCSCATTRSRVATRESRRKHLRRGRNASSLTPEVGLTPGGMANATLPAWQQPVEVTYSLTQVGLLQLAFPVSAILVAVSLMCRDWAKHGGRGTHAASGAFFLGVYVPRDTLTPPRLLGEDVLAGTLPPCPSTPPTRVIAPHHPRGLHLSSLTPGLPSPHAHPWQQPWNHG